MKFFPSYFRVISGTALLFFVIGCKTEPYAPPAKKAAVDSVEVTIRDFERRPEAYAIVKGHLSTSVAQLVDASQTREGNTLHISVMEQTPRGAVAKPDLGSSRPFEKLIPINILGLESGRYTVTANGIVTQMEIPETFDPAPRDFSKKTPHKVKWRPAPLPVGTVKMMAPLRVNQQPAAARQIASSVNASTSSDPFSSQNQALPPGMSASVSMEPHRPLTQPKPAVKKPELSEENAPTFDSLAGSANTVSTLSGGSKSQPPISFRSLHKTLFHS